MGLSRNKRIKKQIYTALLKRWKAVLELPDPKKDNKSLWDSKVTEGESGQPVKTH